MRATHRVMGCVLCLAVMGSAAAASLGAPGVDNAPHAVTSRSSQSSTSSDSDAIGASRDSTTTDSDATSSTSSSGNDHHGAASSAPTPAPRPHLGWQSLLPGSIQ